MVARLTALLRFHWRRARGRRMPDEIILAVTSACNARCSFCYYWEELNQGGVELSLEEIERIARSLDPFRYLWIAGGEPFLRADLPEIIAIFVKINRISGVHIPTNGLPQERMRTSLERLLELAPNLSIKLLVSLQGPKELHDSLFGVPGAFRQAMSTLEYLGAMSRSHPNITVSVNTVVSDRNIRHFRELLEITKNLDIADHVASPVRGSPKDAGLRAPTPEQWRRVAGMLLDNNREHHFDRDGRGLSYFLNVSRFFHQQNIFMRVLAGRGLPFLCAAGDAIAVIESKGDVRICELKGKAANLRDYGFDFRRLWASRPLAEARAAVSACSCTHACFISASLNARPTHFFRSLFAFRLTP